MSLFQCEHCGCAENTALSLQGTKGIDDWFDWTGIEDRKGKLLCSACGPPKDEDGDDTKLGTWHGEFERVFLPMGEFKTNREGNLEHVKTGSTDFRKFAIENKMKQPSSLKGHQQALENLNQPCDRPCAKLISELRVMLDDREAALQVGFKPWVVNAVFHTNVERLIKRAEECGK